MLRRARFARDGHDRRRAARALIRVATGSGREGQRSPEGRILAALCVTVTVSYGTLYYAFAVLAPSIAREEGWSLTAITAAFSAASLVTGLVGIPVGRAVQRRGPRAVMVGGSAVGSAGLAGLAVAPSYAWFVAAMLVCGAAAAGLFYAPAFAAITHWFGDRRVQALTGLTLVAGFASTIFAPLTALLAQQAGWRVTYLVLAGLLLITTLPFHAVALDHPWEVTPGARQRGSDRDVIRSQRFVLVALASTLVTLAMYASVIALVPLLVGRGVSSGVAAWALGLGGAGQVAGRLLYPWLSRTVGLQGRVTLVTAAVAATIAGLAAVPGPALLLLGAAIAAGVTRGLFTLVGATLVSDIWGPDRYAALNGVLMAPSAAAAAVGPFLGAWLAHLSGGYPATFVVFAAIALVAAALMGAALRDVPVLPARTALRD